MKELTQTITLTDLTEQNKQLEQELIRQTDADLISWTVAIHDSGGKSRSLTSYDALYKEVYYLRLWYDHQFVVQNTSIRFKAEDLESAIIRYRNRQDKIYQEWLAKRDTAFYNKVMEKN